MATNDENEKIYEETREYPIQDYETPPPPPEETVQSEEIHEPEYITDKEVKSEMNALKLSEPLANLLVNLLNIVLPAIVCNFSPEGNDDKLDLIMDGTEREATTYAIANFIKETNFDLSPGGVLLTTLISVYTPKFIYVFYTKRQQHIETMSAMQRQIELLTQQNEMLRAKTGA